MKAMVRQAVADGAFGLSSGLFYTPGRFSKTEEVIALAREAGGVYTSHIRDEGDYDVGVIASVDEVIRIAEEARVRGIVSHVKALGPDNWGKSKTIVEHIEAARAKGIEVFADQYPYEASSTSLMAATMLHSVATGNILPASIPLTCVDINPATVTKLADRGSSQARGIVTDVGLFIEHLARELSPSYADGM